MSLYYSLIISGVVLYIHGCLVWSVNILIIITLLLLSDFVIYILGYQVCYENAWHVFDSILFIECMFVCNYACVLNIFCMCD